MLEVLIKHNGEMLSTKELWEEAFPGQPQDRNTVNQLRNWMKELTYKRQPIIVHTEKRGRGSAYGIMDFEITYTRTLAVSKPASTAKPAPAPNKSSTEPVPEAASIDLDPTASHETVEDTNYFPLTSYESLVVAEFLISKGDVMQELGLDPISEDVVKALRKIPTGTAQKRMIEEYGTLPDARRSFLEELKKLIADDDAFFEAIDNMETSDPRWPLFDYFSGMEGEERWELMTALVNGDSALSINVLLGKFGGTYVTEVHAYTEIDGVRYPRKTGSDESTPALKPEYPESAPQPKAVIELDVPIAEQASPVSSEDEPAVASEDAEQRDVPMAAEDSPVFAPEEMLDAVSSEPASQALHAVTPPDVAAAEKDPRNWEKDFKHSIGEAIDVLHANGLLKPGTVPAKLIRQLSNSDKLGTTDSLQRLVKAGIIKRLGRVSPLEYPMDAQLILTTYLYNQHQLGVLGKHNKQIQKRALQLIQEATDSFLSRYEET